MRTRQDIQRAHEDQKRIYRDSYEERGDDYGALRWSSRRVQQVRFEVLARLGELHGASVLDLGCGLGDLCGYLAEQGIEADITGYDIVPEMVDACRQRYPEARFECRNILLAPPRRRFDFVLASGVFAYGNATFFREMLAAAWALARRGFGFNLYCAKSPEYFVIAEQAATAHCEQLAGATVERVRGYLPRDYSLLLRRHSAHSATIPTES